MTGFVGPNGAGKTSTMRIVLGVLGPDDGTVTWEGRPLDAAARRGFGYMPEERGLYPKMRVGDQLVYLARLHGLDGPTAQRAADDLLERLDLFDRARDELEALSLGNQQRVQLAAALVHRPSLLVLDEPFSGLDPIGVDVLAGVSRRRSSGACPSSSPPISSSSSSASATSVAIVKAGRIVAAGAVETLRRRDRRRLLRVEVDAPGRAVARRPARCARDRPRRRRRPARRAGRRRRPPAAARPRPRRRPGHPLQHRAADADRAVPRGGRGVISARAGWSPRRELTDARAAAPSRSGPRSSCSRSSSCSVIASRHRRRRRHEDGRARRPRPRSRTRRR